MGSGVFDDHDRQHWLKVCRRAAMSPHATPQARAKARQDVKDWKEIIAANGGDPRPPHLRNCAPGRLYDILEGFLRDAPGHADERSAWPTDDRSADPTTAREQPVNTLRFHLIAGDFVQINYATAELLVEVERLLTEPNAVIKLPSEADLHRDEFGGDEPDEDDVRKYRLIPVRAITYVEQL